MSQSFKSLSKSKPSYISELKHKIFTTNHTDLGATLEDSVNATGIFGIIHLLLCTLSFLSTISNKKGQKFTIFLLITLYSSSSNLRISFKIVLILFSMYWYFQMQNLQQSTRLNSKCLDLGHFVEIFALQNQILCKCKMVKYSKLRHLKYQYNTKGTFA